MACFLVPAAEAVVTTAARHFVKRSEARKAVPEGAKLRLSQRLGWLNNMLWGGSALLAFEHLWHGEVEPFFPFLTAARDPAALEAMLHEMATSGTAMAALVTLAWGVMCAAAAALKGRAPEEEAS